MAELKRLADFAKNGRERVIISLSEYRGTRFVDLRLFATASDASLIPTPKGVGIRPSMIRETVAALLEAERILIADGTLKRETGGMTDPHKGEVSRCS